MIFLKLKERKGKRRENRTHCTHYVSKVKAVAAPITIVDALID